MKAFAIRDGYEKDEKDLAYLIYYEKEKIFYIELPEDADEWETPLLLSSFAKRGEKTVSAYFSRLWVQQRIVPPDRQNLGQILKDNGLHCYDEFSLLMLADGRCAQDEYYLVPISQEAAKLLECSRQNISDLVRRGRLHPVKADAKNTLFLKSDVMQRRWE